MKKAILFSILILSACSRYEDQKIELSHTDSKMLEPPCSKCRLQLQQRAHEEAASYSK